MDGKKIEDWTDITDSLTDDSLTIVQTASGSGKTSLSNIKNAMGTSDKAFIKLGTEPDDVGENKFTLPINSHITQQLDQDGEAHININPITIGASPKNHKFTESERTSNDYGVADSTHYGHTRPSLQIPAVQTAGNKQGSAGTPDGIYSPADHVHPSDPNKQDVITGAAQSITETLLTQDRVVITDSNGKITQSQITTQELNQLSGVSGGINSRLSNIEDVIPNEATSGNQLADKNFVNSSIQTSTSVFRGSFDTYEDFQDSWNTLEASINDYAVVLADENHYDETWRYKYAPVSEGSSNLNWVAEYKINDTAFTAAQNAAINSGATSALIAKISTNEQNISTNATAIETVSQSIKNNTITIKKGNSTVDSFTLNQSTDKAISLPDYYEKSDVYTKTEIDNIADDKIDISQGVENSGKVMIVGSDGDVAPTEFKALPTPTGEDKLLISVEDDGDLDWSQIDASEVGQVIQLTTMPTASVELLGVIRQYIGVNTQDFVNGNFYRCKSSSGGGYEWQKIEFGGKSEVPSLTELEYNQLDPVEKNDHTIRCVTNMRGADIAISEINDENISNDETWSSNKISENLGTFICDVSASSNCVITSSNLGNVPLNKQTLKVLFENGHYGSSFTLAFNTGVNIPIYKTNGGTVSLMTPTSINRSVSGEGTQNWYCQEYTTLELVYLQSLNSGSGGFLVIGNPVVLNSSSYTVYADGTNEYNKTQVDNLISTLVSSNTTGFKIYKKNNNSGNWTFPTAFSQFCVVFYITDSYAGQTQGYGIACKIGQDTYTYNGTSLTTKTAPVAYPAQWTAIVIGI